MNVNVKMGEESSNRDSISDSSFSRSSGDALIAKSPLEKSTAFEFTKRGRKNSKKIVYDFLDRGIEAQKDSFRWIPNPAEGDPQERRSSSVLKETDSVNLTLESARTPSSYTSDFPSNTYDKNGYIRGTNEKDCKKSDSLLKYNEFSSLMTTLGSGNEFPMEVKVSEKNANKGSAEGKLKDENATYVITGAVQLMMGILMAVFGVLVIAYGSSLSGVGSGLWGGAVAMFSGLLGILAGLKGCYSTTKTETKISPTLLTGYLALCLVSFALSNLVLVLTATGLIRDLQTPIIEEEKNSITLGDGGRTNWPPVLADVALMLAAALQCIVTVVSGYKCYKQVCPCLRKDHNRLSETDSSNQKYKTAGKDRLVNHWLGQQFLTAQKTKKKGEKQEGYVPWGTPNIVFLPPPPPIITSGQVPIWTFLQAPSSVFGSSTCSHMYGGSVPCCCHHDNRYHVSQQPMVHEGRPLRRIDPDPKIPARSRAKKCSSKDRRASLPTAEEVAKTYTGLDREIAEEFIAIAMDSGRRRSRNNSLGDCREYTVSSMEMENGVIFGKFNDQQDNIRIIFTKNKQYKV